MYTTHKTTTSSCIYLHPKNSPWLLKLSPKEFYRYTGVTYLSHLSFESYSTYQTIKRQCKKAQFIGAIDQQIEFSSVLYSQFLKDPPSLKLAIQWMNEKYRFGLFTHNPIKKGAFIGEYTGMIKRVGYFFNNTNDYCFSYTTAPISWRKYTIDAQFYGNEMRFLNHSSRSNVESLAILYEGIFHIIFIAKRAIEPQEELRFDYGTRYWKTKNYIPED